MKDKELKIEEIEVSHTLARSGEDRVQGRGKGSGQGVDTTWVLDLVWTGYVQIEFSFFDPPFSFGLSSVV